MYLAILRENKIGNKEVVILASWFLNYASQNLESKTAK